MSGCLLGQEIRYNGQHKRHPHVVEELNDYFEYISFCPEVSMGLGIPRNPIQLMEKENKICLVDVRDGSIDYTTKAYEIFGELGHQLKESSGIILMKGSPSCGLEHVNVYDPATRESLRSTKGLWAQYLSDNFPLIPKIDSGRLYDDELRDQFRTQVILYNDFFQLPKTRQDLTHFHNNYKSYLFQYGPEYITNLENICEEMTEYNKEKFFFEYADYLFGTVFLDVITIEKRIAMVEYLARDLLKSEASDLQNNINAFSQGKLSFKHVITLIGTSGAFCKNHYFKRQKIFDLYSKI